MKIRHVIRYIVPIVGTIHFGVALLWWCDLLFYIANIETLASLPADRLLLCVVIPLQSCQTLLPGFAAALYFTRRNSHNAHPLAVTSVGIACLLFTLSSTSSFAQVHVFGRPGLNHFYATWWPHSRILPQSIVARALIAAATFFVAITLTRCSKHNHAEGS